MDKCGIMSESNIKRVVGQDAHTLDECRAQVCRIGDVRKYGICVTLSLSLGRRVDGYEGCRGGCGGDVG